MVWEILNYLSKISKLYFKVLIQKDDENSLKNNLSIVLITIFTDMLVICKERINRGIYYFNNWMY